MNRLIPGRSCPLSYRYDPSVFVRAPDFQAETVYIVGGLYGNEQALDAVAEMCASETEAALVFNGDFNWFNAERESFVAVNRRVLEHRATRGNVETEIAAVDAQAGCGCAYPEWVRDAEVEWSNRIMTRLRATARAEPGITLALAALPMHLVAGVGANRVAIVHGDLESLAGWDLAQEHADDDARCVLHKMLRRSIRCESDRSTRRPCRCTTTTSDSYARSKVAGQRIVLRTSRISGVSSTDRITVSSERCDDPRPTPENHQDPRRRTQWR